MDTEAPQRQASRRRTSVLDGLSPRADGGVVVRRAHDWVAGTSPRWAIVAVLALFVGVTALRWFFDGAGQAVALLYVVPIALAALRFGQPGGIATGGLGAVAFVVLAAVHGRGDLDLTGWVGPVLVMVLVGGLVGSLADLAARRKKLDALLVERSRRLEQVCDAQRAALAVGDSIVQHLAAARWMLETGRSEEAIDVLGGAVAEGIAKLSEGFAFDPVAPGSLHGEEENTARAPRRPARRPGVENRMTTATDP